MKYEEKKSIKPKAYLKYKTNKLPARLMKRRRRKGRERKERRKKGVPVVAQWLTNPTIN